MSDADAPVVRLRKPKERASVREYPSYKIDKTQTPEVVALSRKKRMNGDRRTPKVPMQDNDADS
jgi:hypothetical protein